jgi:probable HAF family extracellular repeat protein
MRRKLVATAIAVIVSIPLIPVIEKGINDLTGGDAPMVFPAQGWMLTHELTHQRGVAVIGLEEFHTSRVGSLQKIANLVQLLKGWQCIDSWRESAPMDLATRFKLLDSPGASAPYSHAGCYALTSRILANQAVRPSGPQQTYGLDFSPYLNGQDPNLNLQASVAQIENRVQIVAPYTMWIRSFGSDSALANIPSASSQLGLKVAANAWIGGELAQENTEIADLIIAATAGQADIAIVSSEVLTSPANGINDRGQVVGYSYMDHGVTHAFLYNGGANKTTSWVPSITSLSPSGATAGGAAFTLTASGSGFLSGATVQWNGSAVPTGFISATQLTVSIPASLTVAAGSASASVVAHINGSPSSLATGYVNPKYLVMGVTYAPPGGASSISYQDTNAVSDHPQRVNKTGWYVLDAGEHSAGRGVIEVEFVADRSGERKYFALEDSGKGGQQAGWIHFQEPGSLVVRARGNEQPVVRGMDYAEFMARSKDSTLQRGVLTVTFLDDVLPLMAYILVVCLIRFIAYWLIGKLPRAVRRRATEEVDLMLAFAKWGGVACYTIWTAKDILAGVGIVLAK